MNIPQARPQVHRRTRRVCTVLSSRPLVRLITEIDDHGAIPPLTMAPTLSDLSSDQVRYVVERATALGLVRRSPAGLCLTPAGAGLAGIYDATARWARRHNHPMPVCDFAGRIRHTFPLLASNGARTETVTDVEGLDRLAQMLDDWLTTYLPSAAGTAGGVAA